MSPRRKRSRLHTTALVVLAVLLLAPVASAQLGDVARKAETQRKALEEPGKVYTNGDLRPDRSPGRPAAPAVSGTTEPPAAGETEEADGEEPVRDETYWRGRIDAARSALSRAETFASALESQVNGLYAELTSCSAPPQCDEISARRSKSRAELERVKQEIAAHTKDMAAIQEEARRAGVPAGWVR